ncbi:4-hydroxythreonine-4-phosphate dehydrogenase PdxA [Thermoproteota archaeon]
MSKKVRIGITIGDPSGIGPEVVVKSLRRFHVPFDSEILIFGDSIALKKCGFKRNLNARLIDLQQVKTSKLRFGVLSRESGRASLSYLVEAVKFLKLGAINCLVTAPVNKQAISLSGKKFYGHTEFLADSFGVKDFAMLFFSNDLKISLVTRHTALRDVARALDKKRIFKTILLTHRFCRDFLGRKSPSIAISGLNPHASEGGLIGDEEKKIIAPAINLFRKKVHMSRGVVGPLPPDTIFHKALNKEFDAVVSMYHDQALIPFKMLHFLDGVNVTLGLPFVRTSCDHGTAFEIAGKNRADHRSLLAAIKLAYKLTKSKLSR